MSAIPDDLADAYPDVFEVEERDHDPSTAPESVRKAWTAYLAEQAVAELAFTRTLETLRELVTQAIETSYQTTRRRQRAAYREYQRVEGDARAARILASRFPS